MRGWFLLYLSAVLVKGKTASFTSGFFIQNMWIKSCVKAVPPRMVKMQICPGYQTVPSLFHWHWTTDGQIQNVATGLCIDVDNMNDDLLRLSTCFYRKSFQKWQRHEGGRKFLLIALHTGKYLRWRFRDDKVVTLSKPLKPDWSHTFNVYYTVSEVFEMNYRDACLQTVGKIPSKLGTCFVAIPTKNNQGYVEIPISTNSPLSQFTISVWIKMSPQVSSSAVAGVFSYRVNNRMVLGLLTKHGKKPSDFFFSAKSLQLQAPRHPLFSGAWTHLTLTWSKTKGKFAYFVNGDLLSEQTLSMEPLPGAGTLWLGRLSHTQDVWFSGFLTEFNIFSQAFSKHKVQVMAQKLHCCNGLGGNWLSWYNVSQSKTMFGDVRQNSGSECTSFEGLPKDWQAKEQLRWRCRSSLAVADPRYTPDHRMSSSSATARGKPSNGRASHAMPNPWCPDPKDRHSFLQVDLGAVKNVTAVGTSMLKSHTRRYAKKIKVRTSVDGVHWETDGMVYETSTHINPPVKIIPLSTSVLARFVRFYPRSCNPTACCLSVEVFGCDPELEKQIFEGEDGCADRDKPYILMDLGEMQHVRRIQIRTQSNNPRKPISAFYLHYMSWNQWVPYQIERKTKIFKGTSETTRSFTVILSLPFIARLIKIFPVPYGQPACGEFLFIGCPSPRTDFCDAPSASKDCSKVEIPQCQFGYIGNGIICQDLNECEQNLGYCDRNSVCKNKLGSFECAPCKNNFIGDGKVCQTSCEALGVLCVENAYCDITECKCREGFTNNGTHCLEYVEVEDIEEGTMDMEEVRVGICPDGFFNCHGDVIGVLEQTKRAALSYTHFDEHLCEVSPDN